MLKKGSVAIAVAKSSLILSSLSSQNAYRPTNRCYSST